MRDEKLTGILAATLALIAVAVAGCSGDSGASTEEIPPIRGASISSYAGPAAATDDVQSFKINLWENVRGDNRCGSCHSVEGGQAPLFARTDDVNLAYAAANGVVTLASPEDSAMVVKVGGGHNCWLTSDAACTDILVTWITNWAGDLVNTGGREIELKAPAIHEPGKSRNFPDDDWQFRTTVYPLLRDNCSDCHSSSAEVPQSPFFAESPESDEAVASAYAFAKSKMNLDDPANSRFVLRLRNESHNCWLSCTTSALAMETAIAAFADNLPLTEIDPNLLTSKALRLHEGVVASGGNRYESSLVASYEFKTLPSCLVAVSITGVCATAFDTSGVDPAMDLHLSGDVDWVGGWGLSFAGGKAQASTAASAKLRTMINATGEYSIEAWVAPGNVVQEDMRIVSYSAGTMERNFNLGQNMYSYDFFSRSSTSDENGNPQLSTPDAAEVLQATLQHVVATFDPVEGRKIYVNSELVAQDNAPGGTLADWDDTFAFVLGNEASSDRDWLGVIRLAAIYNRALTPGQIKQNFEAGVGEKFFLLFSVEHLTLVPESFVVFEVTQYDSYSYLFRKPIFVSLDPAALPSSLDLAGLRIGMNGKEAHVGQSYANLDAEISTYLGYTPTAGQTLATIGAVVPLEKGAANDEFFLTFERIGTHSFDPPEPTVPPPPTPQPLPPAADIGVRTFDEISATMAAITGVSQLDPGVQSTFDTVRQSLPAVDTIEAFLASHQVAIAQLAIEYCNALVEDPALRATRFPGFPFTQGVSAAFPGPGATEDLLLDPLLNRALGSAANPVATQPDHALVKIELTHLIHGIPGNSARMGLANGGGAAARTQTISKAVCAALLGSGAMLVQ